MAHVPSYKSEAVEALVRNFEGASVVGIVNIRGIPAPQFQAMRKKLRGKATIVVTKNNLLRIALRQAGTKKAGLEKLADVIEDQTAVVTSSLNPFRLFKEMESTKTKAPARGGESAPEDIWVREGETPFKPGPIVGELQKAGIPAAIERGKVVVKKDKLLVRTGERIPRDVAHVLARLEIYPLTVGLDLRGAYEGGMVFARDVLAVDDAKIRADLALADARAMALALALHYPSPRTIRPLLAQAYRRALTLAIGAAFPTPDTVKFLLAKAQAEALALAARAPDAVDEATRAKLGGSPSREGPAREEPEKGDKKEEKPADEDVAAGLGALFGS